MKGKIHAQVNEPAGGGGGGGGGRQEETRQYLPDRSIYRAY